MEHKHKFIRIIVDKTDRERKNTNLSMFENSPDAILLDCGCNDGQLTLEVAQKISTGNIFGIDCLTENIIASGKRGIKSFQHDLNNKLPFADESFDVIHAGDIIEHLFDTDTFIKEIYRITKAGGYVVISTNNLASLHNIIYLLFGRQPAPAAVSDKVVVGGWRKTSAILLPGAGHQRLFTLGALTGLCEYHGFHVEKTRGSGFYPFPVVLARILAVISKNHSSYIAIKARKEDRKE